MIYITVRYGRGGSGGGGHPARCPPKIGEKNMIFWRKIMIFHTKYPQKIGASLHSAQFLYVHPCMVPDIVKSSKAYYIYNDDIYYS